MAARVLSKSRVLRASLSSLQTTSVSPAASVPKVNSREEIYLLVERNYL
jgi:hypothetical protein